jgi:hypothetical protein
MPIRRQTSRITWDSGANENKTVFAGQSYTSDIHYLDKGCTAAAVSVACTCGAAIAGDDLTVEVRLATTELDIDGGNALDFDQGEHVNSWVLQLDVASPNQFTFEIPPAVSAVQIYVSSAASQSCGCRVGISEIIEYA